MACGRPCRRKIGEHLEHLRRGRNRGGAMLTWRRMGLIAVAAMQCGGCVSGVISLAATRTGQGAAFYVKPGATHEERQADWKRCWDAAGLRAVSLRATAQPKIAPCMAKKGYLVSDYAANADGSVTRAESSSYPRSCASAGGMYERLGG